MQAASQASADPFCADAALRALAAADALLPAVAPAAQTAQALRARFAAPPRWQPDPWPQRKPAQRAAVPAAVLLAIVLRAQPMLLLTERSAQLSTHPGQVAFPGGRADAQDAGPADTALREAQEEVGLARGFVEVLGCLPAYLTGSAFSITPVVALVQPDCTLCANPGEVARLFEVPLAFVLDPANHRRHALARDGVRREWFSIPWQSACGAQHHIWGATAGMLRNFYHFMRA